MRGEYDEALRFARWVGGGKLAPLTVIGDNQIDLVVFEDDAAAKKWLIQKNESERANIYFQVNSLLRAVNKKATRADIKQLDFIHVDLDARAGEDFDEELPRIRGVIEGMRPKPSAVVFSGGGYQVFWRLRKPFLINGDAELYEQAARYNLKVANDYGGDHCFNVDRVMRLPGTINHPNKVKRAKGRKPVLSSIVEMNDLEYDLSEFTQAPLIQAIDKAFRGEARVNVSSNLRLGSVDELDKYEVPDFHKQLIVQGRHGIANVYPDKQYPSDSEAVWAVACELVRRKVPDEIIFAVLTDPDFLISAHIFRQPRHERYAVSQIERAHEHAADPVLAEMNENHAVIADLDGRCVVMSLIRTGAGESETLSFQSFDAFKNRYCHRRGPGEKSGPLGEWWLRNPERRQYSGIIFNPGRDVPGYYNLWRGFAVEPRPGDWSLLKDHVLVNVCGGRQDLFDYVINWMARTVQLPNDPGQTAIVMRGGQGTGKGFLARSFGALFGEHYTYVSNAKHIVGQFNSHLSRTVLLFADEAFAVGDKQHESVLKTLITESRMMTEKKGVDPQQAHNYIHLMIASNEDWVVPVGRDDRRFLVLDVGDAGKKAASDGYFSAIQDQLDAGGYSAMLHELLSRDLTGWNVRALPSTAASTEQKMYSLWPIESWWLEKLRSGVVLDGYGWEDPLPVSSIVYDLSPRRPDPHDAIRLGIFLRKIAAPLKRKRVQKETVIQLISGERRAVSDFSVYILPPLDECERLWNIHYPNIPIVRDEVDDGEEGPSSF